ncbi:T9SS type A sorting domain-containing protein [Dyadobacter luticola]|uniref:T9SS type A sorting domain-containing protein n=1 Tax=Dyadobacter luticola TaxID=1979387 RepID=A0A5R9KWW7_9BACT|nr:T9SS type A sorting domain-containing protein [Dyadobacter luticola]TLV00792.1 T9SS type A sorting domain-containing protein [Dyadobacter luticola]
MDAGFEGSIPAEVGNLVNLTKLRINGMTKPSAIPVEIGNLINLTDLHLSNNVHTGTIPASFNNLTKISTIILDDNQLVGPIPDLSALPPQKIGIANNFLNFDQLEPNASRFAYYAGQRSAKVHKTKDVLSVYAGGTLSRNKYRWVHAGAIVATIIGDSTYKMPEQGSYYVIVTNSLATNGSILSEVFENPLPVKLIAFEVTNSNNQNNLTWKTSSETNNKGFEIERSADARTFTKIGYVEGNGDSNELNNYHFTDQNPSNITYYRLKQLDYDDTFEYSKIIMAKSDQQLSIYPNPAKDYFNVMGLAKEEKILVIDQSGNVILHEKIGVDGSVNTANISSGIYNIEVGGATKKLLIIK